MNGGGKDDGDGTGSNQFFCRSHQLLIAITFDPELRLAHGLRLREALVILLTTITHEKHGWWFCMLTSMVVEANELRHSRVVDVKCWRNGGRYDLIGVEER
ncbi:hypothetical protein PIB30_038644 [Stylosanthes scabra]|uniref:Uncharacterized protein n=1 Tax=Stylosanthes scabra TaxID=79078 RepID=A0ABU6WE75_9FABA|nr:hypothetical protein [Stylosanthes scabra]